MPLVAMLLYALMITPMVIEVRADAGEDISAHARIRVWRLAFQFDAVVRRGKDGPYVSVREKQGTHAAGTVDIRAGTLIRAFLRSRRLRRFLLARVRLHQLTLAVRLGAGDAAYTAWLCGAIMALTFPLTQWVRRRQGIEPRFDVRCAWDSETLVGSVQGIIALLPGDIMAALVLAAAQKLRKEAKRRWTGIPLKA